MESPDECRKKAREAEDAAQRLDPGLERQTALARARELRRLADEIEARRLDDRRLKRQRQASPISMRPDDPQRD